MNKNIKLAIYFLLGIVLFYLMFNGNGVEGFGQGVNFIYVRVNTGDFERFVILDAGSDDIPTHTSSGATGLQGELNEILNDENNTYYKSASGNLFIQKVVAASCTGGSNCSGISTSGSCAAATCTFSSGDGNASCTGSPSCIAIAQPNASNCGSCTFNGASTEYYLVIQSDDTINSIHKITPSSDLDGLSGDTATPVEISGTDDPSSPLKIFNVPSSGDASGSYTSASGTTVTIDTFPRCSTPESITGYTPVETSLKLGEDFNVSGTCASGYRGTLAATVCASDNTPYRLRGCTIETHDFTCNNGSAASGSSTTPTESCTACHDGYSLDSNRCVPNGSCSDFTATCPEGKEVNEDKSCSGTCTADECCEEESNLVMICLVVCLLIFCVILIGAGAYLTIGKKSSGPPIQSGPPGY